VSNQGVLVRSWSRNHPLSVARVLRSLGSPLHNSEILVFLVAGDAPTLDLMSVGPSFVLGRDVSGAIISLALAFCLFALDLVIATGVSVAMVESHRLAVLPLQGRSYQGAVNWA